MGVYWRWCEVYLRLYRQAGYRHDICQIVYATAVSGAKILRRKRVNRDISQFTTKARKCFKMDMFATKERKCILCQSTTQIYARFDYKLHVIRQHQTNIVHKNLFNVCKFTTSYTFCVKVAEKYTQYA